MPRDCSGCRLFWPCFNSETFLLSLTPTFGRMLSGWEKQQLRSIWILPVSVWTRAGLLIYPRQSHLLSPDFPGWGSAKQSGTPDRITSERGLADKKLTIRPGRVGVLCPAGPWLC